MEPVLTFEQPDNLKTLLGQPSPSLEDILDQESVVNQFKSANEELVTYLIGDNTFDKLVSYVCEGPSDNSLYLSQPYRNLKATKFPFIACEILSAGNDKVAKRFLGLNPNQGEPLNSIEIEKFQAEAKKIDSQAPIIKLLSFLDAAAPIDFTLAGYFCKVFRQLFLSAPLHVASLLFSSSSLILRKIASHIYSDSIHELLQAILKLDSSSFRLNPGEHYVTERIQRIEQLIANLVESPKQSSDILQYDIQNNSSLILCSLLSACACFPNGKKVISPLLAPVTLHKILQGLLNPVMTKLLVPLVHQLCSHFQSTYSTMDKIPLLDLVSYTECVIPAEIPESEPFIAAVLDSVEGIFNSYELDNQPQNPSALSFNPNQRKVSLCEIVSSFLKLQNPKVDAKIVQSKGLITILNVFAKNPWNNILHNEITKLVTLIVKHGSPVLKQALLEQAKVLDLIIQESKDPFIQCSGKKNSKTKKSYLAYFDMIAEVLNKSQDNIIRNFCDNNQVWQNFQKAISKEEEKKLPVEEEPPKTMPSILQNLEDLGMAQDDDDDDDYADTPIRGPRRQPQKSFGLSFDQVQEDNDDDDCNWPVKDPEMTPKASKNIEWDDF